MPERYYDDLKIGDRFDSRPFAITEEAIIEFAGQFDPQQFHLNAEFASQTIFKGLTASGWHTAAVSMRLFVQTLNFAQGAIGLGVDELRWPAAVRPGDILRVQTDLVDLRLSRSKAGFGIVKLKNTTRNQKDEIVQTMFASALVRTRS